MNGSYPSTSERAAGLILGLAAGDRNGGPIRMAGPWQAGWALAFHSRFAGDDRSRSPAGELTYRLKYQGEQAALPPLVEQVVALCAEHPGLAISRHIVQAHGGHIWAESTGYITGRFG